MKLEQQVCTLQQAKRLKELGINADSYFEHCKKINRDWFVRPKPYIDTADFKETYPAYTVAELGVMLPAGYDTMMVSNFDEFTQPYGWFGYDLNGDYCPSQIVHTTEAQARAAMLIYLLENNLITAEEVNQRLAA